MNRNDRNARKRTTMKDKTKVRCTVMTMATVSIFFLCHFNLIRRNCPSRLATVTCYLCFYHSSLLFFIFLIIFFPFHRMGECNLIEKFTLKWNEKKRREYRSETHRIVQQAVVKRTGMARLFWHYWIFLLFRLFVSIQFNCRCLVSLVFGGCEMG